MRANIIIALWVGWISAGAAAAQSYPADAQIAQPSVEVRSGPGLNFYATSILNRGDKVRILRVSKQPGWLEIDPPPRSYSWINQKFLMQGDKTGKWIVSTPAVIRPGSQLPGAPAPNVETMSLAQGSIVLQAAQAQQAETETWLPIYPYVGEVRYIPADAVQPASSTPTIPASSAWVRTPQDSFVRDPNLANAMAREAAGDKQGALAYYQQVASNPNADPNSKVLAWNAMSRLQQPAYGAVQGTTTSLSSPANPASVNLQTLKAPEWSAYGRLREIKMQTADGLPLYALEDSQGKIVSYVSVSPGKSLQTYIGRWVSVYGPTMYRADAAVRMPYVVAGYVAVP